MSYVNITRTELEDWLTTKNYSWERVKDKQGVYLITLSPTVAIKLSSTQTKHDHAMGRGFASMNLTLVSHVNGWTLNRKARDRKHFKRTTIGEILGPRVFLIGSQNTTAKRASMIK